MRSYNICCLPGDGIGPEIMAAGRQVLDAAASRFGFEVNCQEQLIGGAAIDECGDPLPAATLEAAQAADAVLLASVGGPKWDSTDPSHPRPEQGLLGIRKALGLYCNLRPVHVFDALVDASSLKPELVRGVDMLIVRELTGGLYFGARERIEDAPGAGMDGEPGIWCSDACEYGEGEIERVVRYAFEAAAGRPQGKVCSVDKANVLDTSRLWRDVSHRVAAEYPQVAFSDMLVDNCAMQLVMDPGQFDVILTENMFGDILSDEASMITGSIGMLSSASLNEGKFGLYEPSHGSAPDIAGKGIANPIATILSAAMMLRFSFDLDKEAEAVENAVKKVLAGGYRTADIMAEGMKQTGTKEMGDLICSQIA